MRIRSLSGVKPLVYPLLRILFVVAFVDMVILVGIVLLHAAAPDPAFVGVASLSFVSLALLSGATLGLSLVYSYERYPALRASIVIIALVTSATLLAHFYVIAQPSSGSIMDEAYYVPSARLLASGQQISPAFCNGALSDPSPNCNPEHPPLGKAFIAAGMVLFGDNPFGWRFFQVILGTFSIPLAFMVAWRLSANSKLSTFAAVLLGLDVMFFVHSSAALIDVQMVFFGLLAFVAYAYRVKVWKFDSAVVAGALLGLATLSKETAVFLALTLLTYNLFLGGGRLEGRLVSNAKIVAVAAVVLFLGYQVYDTLLASAYFPTFLDQINYTLNYGSSLRGPGWLDAVTKVPITPLSWIAYYPPIQYFVSTANPCGGAIATCVGVAYYGVTNLIETWLAFLWVPFVTLTLLFRPKAQTASLDAAGSSGAVEANSPGEMKVAALALFWFLWNYVPYLYLFAVGRVTYPFYIVPAIPGVALGVSFLITRKWFPSNLALFYLAVAFFFYFEYFVDKSFLPGWLRVLIGK